VSVSSSGAQGNGASSDPKISGNGRWVSFYSDATNLVPGDTNIVRDVFLRDLQTGYTQRLSVSTAGVQSNGLSSLSEGHTISADGRFAVYYSDATNLVSGDTNLFRDSFLRDTSPWKDLGGALAGISGNPKLQGSGSMYLGDVDTLALANAAPGSFCALFVSFSSTPVSLKGGVLQAFPSVVQVGLATDGSGGLVLPFPTPAGLPSGFVLYFQDLISDPAAVHGVAFSNAVKVTAP
jgi:hypothetical protein